MDDKMNLSEKDDPKKGAKGGAGKVFFTSANVGSGNQKSPRFGLSAFRKKIIE